MKTHTQLVKPFFATLLLSTLVLTFVISSSASAQRFTGGTLAKEKFALVCGYVSTMDISDGKRTPITGHSTFVFEENQKRLELLNISGDGLNCGTVPKFLVTKSEFLIQCERTSGVIISQHIVSIHRFSGKMEQRYEIKENGKFELKLIHSAVCTKKSKKF